jgi:hypothetical protein
MNDELQPLNAEGLQIIPSLDGDTLAIKVVGVVEMRDPGEVLNPFWIGIDELAISRQLKRVEVDFRDLSFMNSSGILTLVRWITRAKGHGASAYRIALQYDGNATWQRTSVPTLAKLAPSIVTAVEIND